MELLELKSVWDMVINDTISRNSVDEFVVAKVIRKDSKTVLTKIKRMMYVKFVLSSITLIAGVTMIIGLFIAPEKFIFLDKVFNVTENRIFTATIVLFISGMLTANYMAFREIASFSNGSDIRTSLQRFVNIMGRTIKLNIYSGTIFNSFAFTWIYYAFASKDEPYLWDIKGLIVIMVVSAVTVTIMYFLGRYEQKLKFGNHLDQLKSNLRDVEGSDK